jgi:hypothetical protein
VGSRGSTNGRQVFSWLAHPSFVVLFRMSAKNKHIKTRIVKTSA